MRIISGTKRGMTILPPKGNATRPITDRVKESIFDVLYKYNLIEGRLVADLFCGTGSFGLEALSRGANETVFVDMDKRAIEILRKNIAKAGFVAQSRIVCANVFKIGAPKSSSGEKSSIVFVDPPYEMSRETGLNSRLGGLLLLLAEQITDDGLVIVRTEKKVHPVRDKMSKRPDNRRGRPVSNGVNLLDNYGDLKIIDKRVWSSMAVAFLALRKDDKQTGGNTDNSHTS